MIELILRAIADIAASLRLRHVWTALASEDVADSHRQTMLGPLWPLLNYMLFAGTIILIFAPVTEGVNFAAYVASGVLVWMFVSDILTTGATLFIREESFIKGTTLPISLYALRLTMLVALRSIYALPAAVVFIIASDITPSEALISVVPAALLILLT